MIPFPLCDPVLFLIEGVRFTISPKVPRVQIEPLLHLNIAALIALRIPRLPLSAIFLLSSLLALL